MSLIFQEGKKVIRVLSIILGVLLRLFFFLIAASVVMIFAQALFQFNHAIGMLFGLSGGVGAIWLFNKVMDM